MKNKLKKKITKQLKAFAIWLLDKTDQPELKQAVIDMRTCIDLSKYLIKKDKWYHVSYTVSSWMKRTDDPEKNTISHVEIYINGKLKSKHLL